MTKLSRKGPQSRVLILFNDVLLYGHSLPGGGVKLRHQLPLQQMRIHASADDSIGSVIGDDVGGGIGSGSGEVAGFEFAIVSRKKSFLLRAATFEIRLQWMQTLVDAVQDYEERLKTFTFPLSPPVDGTRKENIINPSLSKAIKASAFVNSKVK